MTERDELARRVAERLGITITSDGSWLQTVNSHYQAMRAVCIPDHVRDALLSAERRYEEAMRGLEWLTVGGSEFVGDVQRCVEYVRKKQEMLQDIAKNAVVAKQAAERRVVNLERQLNAAVVLLKAKCSDQEWEEMGKKFDTLVTR